MEKEDQKLSGKEAYEARKAERQQKQVQKQRVTSTSRTGRKVGLDIVVIVILGAVGYGLFLLAQQSGPQGEDFSRVIPLTDNNRDHIPLDSLLPVYTSNPPTSGPHYGDPAHTGFRGDVDLPDGHYIHTMEHGNIWISYQPDVSDAVVKALEKFAGNQVVISARAANETDIAVAAWGRLDTFDVGEELTEADEQRIRDFILRYTNKAPEQLPATAHSQGI